MVKASAPPSAAIRRDFHHSDDPSIDVCVKSMIKLTQYNGEVLELSHKPSKIISLVPSITENLIQFGTKPMACTSFCIEPRDIVKDIPVIGGTKTPRVSKIISMKPDLVIANQEENIREHVEEIVRAGIPVWITFPNSISETLQMMQEMISIIDDPYSASNWIEKIKETLKNSQVIKINAITLIWKDPWMAVGKDTYASNLLSFCGIGNLAAPRYPEISKAEIQKLQPDLIILPTEPYEFTANDLAYWNEIAPTISFVGEDLLWSGTRIPRAVEKLTEISKLFEKKTLK